MTGPIETEVKIPMRNGAEAARGLIEAHGYRMTIPRGLQADQVFDFPDRTLRQNGKLLRVRSESGSGLLKDAGFLTYKGPAFTGLPHKSREELEIPTGDSAMLERILERLGFVRSFRYEKYRTTFQAPDEPGLVVLDETPIGVFLELEGPAYWIDSTALRLGFAPKDYVTASYAALYQDYLKSHEGPADMVFI